MYFILYALGFFAGFGSAQNVGVGNQVAFGCWSASFTYNYTCPREFTPYACHCGNENFLATALTCINMYLPDKRELHRATNYVQDQCRKWGNRTLSRQDMGKIYQKGLSKLIDPSKIDISQPVGGTVVIPRAVFQKQYLAGKDMKYRYNLGNIFGLAMIGYWVFVVLVATLKTFLQYKCPAVFDHLGKLPNYMRKFVTLPAVFGNKHHVSYRLMPWYSLSAPTRGQTIIIVGFLALNIVSLVTFFDLEDNSPLVFTDNSNKVLRYMANRTGIIATSYLPVVVLFASRNNPLIYISGFPYDTFQLYHRWSARMMGLHAVIHGILLTVFSVREHVLLFKWHHIFNWRAGNVGVYAVIIMVIMALRVVRRKVYEWFLIIHQMLFIAVLVAVMVHCSDYGWMWYPYCALGFYVLEYIMRVGRMVSSGGIQKAEFRLVAPDMFRVSVTGNRKWKVGAGHYVYIRILKKGLMWQSHPFSIFQSPKGQATDSVELCIKAKGGATLEIVNHLKDKPTQYDVMDVILEGPYGRDNQLQRFDNVFLLAGGVGITAMYSYVNSYTNLLRFGQILTLVWVVAHESSLDAFQEELEVLAKLQYVADVQIYVTKPRHPKSTISMKSTETVGTAQLTVSDLNYTRSSLSSTVNTDESVDSANKSAYQQSIREAGSMTESEDQSSLGLDTLHATTSQMVESLIHYCRPNVKGTVERFIARSKGSMAICSCGPPSFVDNTRTSIVENIQKATKDVQYFEEAFSW